MYQIVNVILNPNPENPQDGCKPIAAAMAKNPTQFAKDVKESLRGATKFGVSWPSGDDMKKALRSLKLPSKKPGTRVLSGKPCEVFS